jgi:hypothetical protein
MFQTIWTTTDYYITRIRKVNIGNFITNDTNENAKQAGFVSARFAPFSILRLSLLTSVGVTRLRRFVLAWLPGQ